MSPEAHTPHTVNLESLRFADSVALGQALRLCGQHASHQDQAAQRVVEHLYDFFRDPQTGNHGCSLIRCFQTHPYAGLPPGAQRSARRLLSDSEPVSDLRCLALLASRGGEADWNNPKTSAGHRAIPLRNVAMVERAPMISRLLAQMGIDASKIAVPGPSLLIDEPQNDFNVFHVENALGSEYIPAQVTFVQRYGIRSVIGMGGLLPSGELFAIMLFTCVPISRDIAELFRTVALSVKLAFLPYALNEVFSRN